MGLARFLLFVGSLAAAVAWWGYAAQQTLLDPAATRDATAGLLAAKPVQDSAINSLTDQLLSRVPAGSASNADMARARTLAHEAATAALHDPQLQRAFGDAIASLQQQLINGDPSRNGLTVDTAAVTAAVRNAVTRADPALAARLPNDPVRLHFDTNRLPNLRGFNHGTDTATLVAALLAMAAWFGAVLVHPSPWTATRLIGRRIVVIGALPLVFWVLIPAGLRALHVSAAEVLAPLASAYGGRLAPAAAAVTAIGAVLWITGHLGTMSARSAARRNEQFPRLPRDGRRGSVVYDRRGTTELLDRVDVRA